MTGCDTYGYARDVLAWLFMWEVWRVKRLAVEISTIPEGPAKRALRGLGNERASVSIGLLAGTLRGGP